MTGKRREKRFKLDDLKVSCKMMFATKVQIIDVSVDGVSLSVDRRLNIGKEYALKLADEHKVFSVKGVVMWSSLKEGRKGTSQTVIPIYSAGMKFSHKTAEETVALLDFIRHNAKEVHLPARQRVKIKLNINTLKKPILHHPEHYNVKSLDLGGMIIETFHAFYIDSGVHVELSLPDNTSVTLFGKVVSCRAIGDEHSKRYTTSIEFQNIKESDREVFSAFLDCLH